MLSWRSEIAHARLLAPGRVDRLRPPLRRRAARPGSGSSRSATPTASGATSAAREVLVAGERRRVVGTVSMDAFAVELDGARPSSGAGDDRRAAASRSRRTRASRARSPTSSRAGSSRGPTRARARSRHRRAEAGRRALRRRGGRARVRSARDKAPGRAPAAQPPGGTSAARRSRAGPSRPPRGSARATNGGSTTSSRSGKPKRERCGKPGVSTKPGVDGEHRDAARGELDRDRARERELGVLGGRVGADRDEAGDRDDVDDVRAALEPGQEGAQAPDRAEVVRRDQPPRSAPAARSRKRAARRRCPRC